jgi:hypothetical protein
MALPYPSKSRTWTTSTPNSGDYFDDEFDQIYANTSYLAGLVGENEVTVANNDTYDFSTATGAFGVDVVDTSDPEFRVRALRSGSDVIVEVPDYLAASVASGTASSLNFYIAGGVLRMENKLGGSKTFNLKEVF